MIKLCIGYNEEQMEPNKEPSIKVADFLEGQYDLYSGFVDTFVESIAKRIELDTAALIENPRPVGDQIETTGTQQIEIMFKKFLTSRQAESVAVQKSENYPVPTMAAIKGKSSRFKKGKGGSRPSFVDSGTIADTVKVWYEK